MNKNMILMSSCLLLISSQVLADRPAMEDNPPMAKPVIPAAEKKTRHRPEAIPVSAVDLGMQQESAPVTRQHTGDTLEIQPGETLPVSIISFPSRGMTMSKVQNELGQPNEISETVGEPPITTWTYNDRIVYFEHSNVIHAVANR